MTHKFFNLEKLPTGRRYEDEYGVWLDFFQTIAESVAQGIEVDVHFAPRSWTAFIYYLGGHVHADKTHFDEDLLIARCPADLHFQAKENGRLRELVELHSASRPELVDALYKADMEWKVDKSKWRHTWQREFKVTCNGSFFRPEVLEYINEDLPKYTPTKKNCVIVPCAADKPYPADLHKAVRSVIPDDFEILIGTGVLGIVPEGLWDVMPLYDSGLPNQWRLMNIAADFFTKHHYENVVVYSDFYNTAIWRGLKTAQQKQSETFDYTFVTSLKEYTNYLNLLDPKLLTDLALTCRNVTRRNR